MVNEGEYVTRDEAMARVLEHPTATLYEVRRKLYLLLERKGIPADVLADIFLFLGVIDQELQIREVGRGAGGNGRSEDGDT